jgi:hypothetical protein
MPEYHWFPLWVWCISGSRSPLLFLGRIATEMNVASTIVQQACGVQGS